MSVETVRTWGGLPGVEPRERHTDLAVAPARPRGKAVAPTGAAVSEDRIGVIVPAPRPGAARSSFRSSFRSLFSRSLFSRLNSRAVRTHFGTVAGVAILAVLLWRLGTGVFLDGLRRIDGPTLLVALGIGLSPPSSAPGAGSWWPGACASGSRSARPSPTTTVRCS
jgi:hypothetical protein